MKKADLYNQLKQQQYKMDIEALRWRRFALEADNEQDRAEYEGFAERDESESMGVFKALNEILPDFKGKLNEESRELLYTWLSKKEQVEELRQAKEVA